MLNSFDIKVASMANDRKGKSSKLGAMIKNELHLGSRNF